VDVRGIGWPISLLTWSEAQPSVQCEVMLMKGKRRSAQALTYVATLTSDAVEIVARSTAQ